MSFSWKPPSLFQTLEVMVKELKDSQSPEGDLLLRKPGRSVLQGISSLRAACPLLCARRAGNGSDRGPGDLCLNQTVQYVPTQAPLPPSSKQTPDLKLQLYTYIHSPSDGLAYNIDIFFYSEKKNSPLEWPDWFAVFVYKRLLC